MRRSLRADKQQYFNSSLSSSLLAAALSSHNDKATTTTTTTTTTAKPTVADGGNAGGINDDCHPLRRDHPVSAMSRITTRLHQAKLSSSSSSSSSRRKHGSRNKYGVDTNDLPALERVRQPHTYRLVVTLKQVLRVI